MKKILILFSVFIIISSGCNRDLSVCPQNSNYRPATSLEKKMSGSVNSFGFKIFQEIAETDADSNMCISPLSISFALGMAYNGAAGSTQEALHQTLEYENMSEQEINETYQSLIHLLTALDPKVDFDIANSAWPRVDFQILESYLDILREYFEAEIEKLDFSDPNAVDIINNWVKDNTQGKIEKILEFIPPDAVLYLINALYFKGDWTYQYDPDDTYESDFTCADRSTVTCEMMSQKITTGFFTTESFKAIDLPYGDGHFSMTIFLPDEDKGIKNLIAQFTPENWAVWMDSFSEQEVDLQMPKFEISYEIELKDVLTALGMGIAFSGSADFSKITENRDIFISRVIHKTFIQVDEVGTEAAAVTAVEFRETAIGNTMILNRPFIYVIRDHVADNLLFMGILSNPDE